MRARASARRIECFSGENSRFKAAITSGGGETGVSIGGGWSF